MTNQISQVNQTAKERNDDELVRLAMDIVNRGAAQTVDRVLVQEKFKYVQTHKKGKKNLWSMSLRFLPLTVEERDAFKKAAGWLRRAINALRPVEDWRFTDDQGHELMPVLESVQRHVQTMADRTVGHGSRSDPRKLLAVDVAVRLLKAAGKPWRTTRHGDADQLSAALWGKPNTDFQEYLRAYLRMQKRIQQARSEREAREREAREPGTN